MDSPSETAISRLIGKPPFEVLPEALREARRRHRRIRYDRMQSIFLRHFQGAEIVSGAVLQEFFHDVATVDENEERLERFSSAVGIEPDELLATLSARARSRRVRNGGDGEVSDDVLFHSIVANERTLALASEDPGWALNRTWASVRNAATSAIRGEGHVKHGERVTFVAIDEARDVEHGTESFEELLADMASESLRALVEDLLATHGFETRDVVIFREYLVERQPEKVVREMVGLQRAQFQHRARQIREWLKARADLLRMTVGEDVSADDRSSVRMRGE